MPCLLLCGRKTERNKTKQKLKSYQNNQGVCRISQPVSHLYNKADVLARSQLWVLLVYFLCNSVTVGTLDI